MGHRSIIAALAGLAALSACAEREVILPGERFGVREVLAAEPPADPASAPDALALPAAVANADWPQSPVSPATRTAHAALGRGLQPLWSVDIGQGDTRRQRLIADPVAGGGRIFTLSSDHRVSAVSGAGAVLWTATLVPDRDGEEQAQGGGLALGPGGRLYVASGFGTLTAFDAATGAEVWSQRLGGTATGAPSVRGDLVYVTSADSVGWAIEAETGRVRWQVEGLEDIKNVAGAPAPATDDKQVIFAFGDGTLQSAFRQGGLRLWQADVAGRRAGSALARIGDITGDPVIDGSVVYAGNHSGRLVAFDVDSGDRIWTVQEGALDPVWPVGGAVYFVSDRNRLMRVNASDGAEVWSVELPGYEPRRRPQARRDSAFANYGPILAGGRLIVASSDGALRAFDPESGALVGRTAIPGGATTRPIVAGGTLYVVSGDGRLLAFR